MNTEPNDQKGKWKRRTELATAVIMMATSAIGLIPTFVDGVNKPPVIIVVPSVGTTVH